MFECEIYENTLKIQMRVLPSKPSSVGHFSGQQPILQNSKMEKRLAMPVRAGASESAYSELLAAEVVGAGREEVVRY